jgi:valyl-tRNA synthetase
VKLEMYVRKNELIDKNFDSVILKMGNLSKIEYTEDKITPSNSFIVDSNEFFIPFGDSVDLESEKEKLSADLKYTQGFLESVRKKLTNEKFMAGAPAQVVEIERKKESDALNKIAILEQKLNEMN